jgi:hypothetical protein
MADHEAATQPLEPNRPSPRALVGAAIVSLRESLRDFIAIKTPWVFVLLRRAVEPIVFWIVALRFRGTNWDSDPPLIFIHIPKCGGSTVRKALEREFPDGVLTVKTPRDLFAWRERHGSNFVPRAIVLVHLPPVFLTRCGLFSDLRILETQVFATVRNPISRFVSGYRDSFRKRFLRTKIPIINLIRLAGTYPLGPNFLFRHLGPVFLGPMTPYFEGQELGRIKIIPLERLPRKLIVSDTEVFIGESTVNAGTKNDSFIPVGTRTNLTEVEEDTLRAVFAKDFILMERVLSD